MTEETGFIRLTPDRQQRGAWTRIEAGSDLPSRSALSPVLTWRQASNVFNSSLTPGQNKLERSCLESHFKLFWCLIIFCKACGLYYKPMTIVNDDSRVLTKLETSPTDEARVIIYDYDRHMSIVQATEPARTARLCKVLHSGSLLPYAQILD